MKRPAILLIILLLVGIVSAQESDTAFVPFTDNLFGIQGLIPDSWQSAGSGVYARNPNGGDVTRLIIQSAPIPRVALLSALRGQLGVDELPEPQGQIETDFSVWDVYVVDLDVQGYALTLSLAVTDKDNVTYIAILQALRDEHADLHKTVFVPVVKSLSAIVAEATEIPYTDKEITFSSGDLTLAGTLSIPQGDGPFPAVILITGSGPQNRDEGLAPVAEIKPFRDIADYLTRNGIAVLRYDERGVGASTGDFASATLQDFRDDASAAVDYLTTRDEIDSAKIGIIGHSEGGLLAPEISEINDNVAFVVTLGGPAVSMRDILLEQNRLVALSFGATEEQIQQALSSYGAVLDALQTGDDATIHDAVIELIKAQLAYRQPDQTIDELPEEQIQQIIKQFTAPIMHSYLEYNVASYWSQLKVPTLAIYGSLDTQVSAEQNVPVLKELTKDNPDITIVTIEGMNHIFQKAKTGSVTEYGDLEQTVMPELLDTITTWILEHETAN